MAQALNAAISADRYQESYFSYAGQEESPVDHDVSFRPGIGADGADTYTPRTLIYDLKGGFGTLRRENALYEFQRQQTSTQQNLWSGSTIPLQLPPIAPSSYQQALDQGVPPPHLTTDTVRFWSDYNHLFYHPRSIVQLNEYEVNSSLMPFEKWQTGEELFSSLDREQDLLDRDLRPFLEECDQLQGLQVISSIDDAWGGFTARYLERINDELGKGCRWVFGLNDTKLTTRERRMLRAANLAQSLYSLNPSASVHIPISSSPTTLPSYISIDASSPWHNAALQAIMVESITLPTRLRSSEIARASFNELETSLNNDGNRRIVAGGMSVDDPGHLGSEGGSDMQQDTRMTNGIANGHDELDEAALDFDVFPNIRGMMGEGGRRLGRRTHTFSKMEALRGPWRSPMEIQSLNEDSRDPFVGGPKTSTHQTRLLFPLLSSYPRIFRFDNRPEQLAVKAVLSTTTGVADQIKELGVSARRFIGIDEREALCDGLNHMAEEYEEGWSDLDESDDDD